MLLGSPTCDKADESFEPKLAELDLDDLDVREAVANFCDDSELLAALVSIFVLESLPGTKLPELHLEDLETVADFSDDAYDALLVADFVLVVACLSRFDPKLVELDLDDLDSIAGFGDVSE